MSPAMAAYRKKRREAIERVQRWARRLELVELLQKYPEIGAGIVDRAMDHPDFFERWTAEQAKAKR